MGALVLSVVRCVVCDVLKLNVAKEELTDSSLHGCYGFSMLIKLVCVLGLACRHHG